MFTRTEQAELTPTAGIDVLIGSGTFGSADNRLLTEETTPLLSSVVLNVRPVRPPHVTEPATATVVAVTLVWILPLHEVDSCAVDVDAANAAGVANPVRAAATNAATTGRTSQRIIFRPSKQTKVRNR